MDRRLENEAILALRQTLGQVSVIRLKEIEFEDERPRGPRTMIVHVEIYGSAHKLVCTIAESADPLDLEQAFLELSKIQARVPLAITSVLIAPSLSEEVQDVCRRSNTGFLDLEGNVSLRLDEVFIVKRALPLHNLISPRAAALPISELASSTK